MVHYCPDNVYWSNIVLLIIILIHLIQIFLFKLIFFLNIYIYIFDGFKRGRATPGIKICSFFRLLCTKVSYTTIKLWTPIIIINISFLTDSEPLIK